ncbi:MAG: sensor histidine kinase [Ruminococcus sp.]
MVKDIRKRIEDIKFQEHQNAVINYKLLATQVDPHFIYNTMNVINIMAQDGRADEVVEINTALIKILRERLNSKISIFETVQTEIDTLMQYCCIINHRHHNQISVHFDIDDT